MQIGWQDPPLVRQSSGSQDNAHLGAAMLILLLLSVAVVVVLIVGVALLM